MINKGHLLLQLRNDNIKISIEELDEIIRIYNHLIDYVLSDNSIIKDQKYDFIDKSVKLHPNDKEKVFDIYYNIFAGVVKFKQYNLLGLLDYILITNELRDNQAWTSPSRIYTISRYIDGLLYEYENYGKNFLGNFIKNKEEDVKDFLIEEDSFICADKIPDSYREIIKTYNEIYGNYYLDFEKYDDIGPLEYDYFVCMTYFYFIMNNLFKNDSYGVQSFLNDLKYNIYEKVDQMNLTGIKDTKQYSDYEDIINYIDSVYNNSKRKIKVIK